MLNLNLNLRLRRLNGLYSLALCVSALALGACDSKGETSSKVGSDAKSAPAAAPETTAYDLRRIRPTDRDLVTVFETLWAQAKKENKRVGVLFSADWCKACQRLEMEFGNDYPVDDIGDVRIFEFVEEDWQAVTRMDELHELRARWYTEMGTYPVMILLDSAGKKLEEMNVAIERLETEGKLASMRNWFVSTQGGTIGASAAVSDAKGGASLEKTTPSVTEKSPGGTNGDTLAVKTGNKPAQP